MRALVHDQTISRVLRTDEVEIDSLLIDDAARLEFMADEPWSWTVDHAVIVARDLPVEASESAVWSAQDVSGVVERVFRPARHEWRAAGAEVAHALDSVGIASAPIDLRAFVKAVDAQP